MKTTNENIEKSKRNRLKEILDEIRARAAK